jgi:hypothetical protein
MVISSNRKVSVGEHISRRWSILGCVTQVSCSCILNECLIPKWAAIRGFEIECFNHIQWSNLKRHSRAAKPLSQHVRPHSWWSSGQPLQNMASPAMGKIQKHHTATPVGSFPWCPAPMARCLLCHFLFHLENRVPPRPLQKKRSAELSCSELSYVDFR